MEAAEALCLAESSVSSPWHDATSTGSGVGSADAGLPAATTGLEDRPLETTDVSYTMTPDEVDRPDDDDKGDKNDMEADAMDRLLMDEPAMRYTTKRHDVEEADEDKNEEDDNDENENNGADVKYDPARAAHGGPATEPPQTAVGSAPRDAAHATEKTDSEDTPAGSDRANESPVAPTGNSAPVRHSKRRRRRRGPATAPDGDDELLDAAIAEADAERARQEAERQEAELRVKLEASAETLRKTRAVLRETAAQWCAAAKAHPDKAQEFKNKAARVFERLRALEAEIRAQETSAAQGSGRLDDLQQPS